MPAMSFHLNERSVWGELPTNQDFGKQVIDGFVEDLVNFGQILSYFMRGESSLTERISRYGKVRFLIVCDENMGRSPLFSIALKQHISKLGLDDFVEVISAGTDVEEKGSKNKNNGGAHPVTKIVMENIPGLDPDSHQVVQFDETLVTPNTILVSLNDPNKINKKIRKKCIVSIDFSMNDPHDDGEGTLLKRLLFLYEREYYLAMYLGSLMEQSLENDNLILFLLCESMHV